MFPMVLLTHAYSIWLHGIFLDKQHSWGQSQAEPGIAGGELKEWNSRLGSEGSLVACEKLAQSGHGWFEHAAVGCIADTDGSLSAFSERDAGS